MTAANSPYYRIGMIHGAYDMARPAGKRRHYSQAYAQSWMYRRGFARAARLARGLAPLEQTRYQTPQQQAKHRYDGRRCWCWAIHTRAVDLLPSTQQPPVGPTESRPTTGGAP